MGSKKMKIKVNIRSIMFFTIIALASLLFINISFAANTGKIIVDTAKLREQPNTDSKVLELIAIDEKVEILENQDNWYKVQYKKMVGFIRSDLIQMENEENKNVINSTNSTETNNTENQNTNNTETTLSENTTVETSVTPVEETIIEKGKYKVSGNVKLKIIPLISAIELNEVNKDVEVEVTEILNDWVKIKTTDGKEGWIRKDKLVKKQENAQEANSVDENKDTQTDKEPKKPVETTPQTTNTSKTMYVNSQTINVRQKADKTSKVIKQLSVNTQVTVLSTSNGWAYVDVSGIKGYIAENLLSSTKQQNSRSSTNTRNTTSNKTSNTTGNASTSKNTPVVENTNTPVSSTGSSVVAYARQYIGCRYVYGGTTPNGFDCSGFTQYVYKHFGVNLNRTAAAQYSNGKPVTSLQVGDLVMFGKSGINHVGIYIGGNSFVHAANKQQGVRIDSLSTGYYKTNYVGARRIF